MCSDWYNPHNNYPQESWPNYNPNPNFGYNPNVNNYYGDASFRPGNPPYGVPTPSTSVEEHAQLVEKFLKNISSRPIKSRRNESRESNYSASSSDEVFKSASSHSKDTSQKWSQKMSHRARDRASSSHGSKERLHSKSSSSRRHRHPSSERAHSKSSSPSKNHRTSSGRTSHERSKSKKSRSLKRAAHKKLLVRVKKDHEVECKRYRNNPKSHPKYHHEKELWLTYMKKSNQAFSHRVIEEEWMVFWKKLLHVTLKHSLKEKMRRYRLPTHKRSRSSSTSSASSSNATTLPTKRKPEEIKEASVYDMNMAAPLSPKTSTAPPKGKEGNYKQDDKSSYNTIVEKSEYHMNDGTNSHEEDKLNKPLSLKDEMASRFIPLISIAREKDQRKLNFDNPETREDLNLTTDHESSDNVSKTLSPKDLRLSEEAFQVVRTLKQIGGKLGLYEDAVDQLFMQFSEEREKGRNLCDFIDKDARMFFTVIKSKIESCLSAGDISLIQRAILEETLACLTTFTQNLEESRTDINLDIAKLANATNGKSCSETIHFLKTVLTHRGLELSNERLMELYLAVTTFQARTTAGDHFPHSNTTFTILKGNKMAPSDAPAPSDNSSTQPSKGDRNPSSASELKKNSNHSSSSKKGSIQIKIPKFCMKVSSATPVHKNQSVSTIFSKDSIYSDDE